MRFGWIIIGLFIAVRPLVAEDFHHASDRKNETTFSTEFIAAFARENDPTALERRLRNLTDLQATALGGALQALRNFPPQGFTRANWPGRRSAVLTALRRLRPESLRGLELLYFASLSTPRLDVELGDRCLRGGAAGLERLRAFRNSLYSTTPAGLPRGFPFALWADSRTRLLERLDARCPRITEDYLAGLRRLTPEERVARLAAMSPEEASDLARYRLTRPFTSESVEARQLMDHLLERAPSALRPLVQDLFQAARSPRALQREITILTREGAVDLRLILDRLSAIQGHAPTVSEVSSRRAILAVLDREYPPSESAFESRLAGRSKVRR